MAVNSPNSQRFSSWLIALLNVVAFSIALTVPKAGMLPAQAFYAPTAQGTANGGNTERLIPRQIANFRIVLGRLQLSQENFRIGSIHERIEIGNGKVRIRSASVSIKDDRPTLVFSDRGSGQDWSIQMGSDDSALIVCSIVDAPASDIYKLELNQPSRGDIRLRVSYMDGRPSQTLQVASLWHLVIDHKDFFDRYLKTAIFRLEPSWDLTETAVEVQRLIGSGIVPRVEPSTIETAIALLNSPEPVERASAYHQLESAGITVQFQLEESLRGQLSSHQRMCLRRILGQTRPSGCDDSIRIALWMSGQRPMLSTLAPEWVFGERQGASRR
jgi:hypothetical protein